MSRPGIQKLQRQHWRHDLVGRCVEMAAALIGAGALVTWAVMSAVRK